MALDSFLAPEKRFVTLSEAKNSRIWPLLSLLCLSLFVISQGSAFVLAANLSSASIA
jgi:hypothetical protein